MTTPQDPNAGADTAKNTTAEDDNSLKVSPIDPPPMRTLVYSPEIQILIARGNKQYDVTNDVVAWSIRRVENGVSSLVFRLSNKSVPGDPKKLRYNQLFERMDRVFVKLKRVEWVPVFSGYLDSVPHVQLYPGTVNFRASCTLKRLLHTWWDPGLPNSRNVFDQAGTSLRELENGEQQLDSGLGSLLRRLLVEVGGWTPESIHIQRFPIGYYNFMVQELNKLSPGTERAAEDFRELILGEGDTSLGVGRAAGRQVGVTMGGYAIGVQERMLEVIRAVDEMGMGPDTTDLAAAQGLGTAAQQVKDNRDQQFSQLQQEVGRNWSEAALQSDAAIHCFMTIAVEAGPGFVMYANAAVPESLGYPHEALSTDGTSVGLYQQQNYAEWGSVSQRMNVKASTQMFLRGLQRLQWRNMDRGSACQAVQRSAFPLRYAEWETWAIEQVRAIRSGTGTAQGAPGQNTVTATSALPGGNLGATPLGSVSTPISAGPLSGGSIPSVPTTNGTPGTIAAATALGKPAHDTASALSCARSMIGRPYEYGAIGPASFDCSGLMQFCYRSAGLEIPRRTTEQKAQGQIIPFANLVPGDLIFPAEYDHVVMYAGGNMMIDAPTTGQTVQLRPINFNIESASCRRVRGAEYGGSPFAPFDLSRATSANNAVAGTSTTGLGGTTSTGTTEPVARNLFTYQFEAGQFSADLSVAYGGTAGTEEKAFINDEPLIQTVITFAEAGMRNFQSAPNGDFIAYYPDYFGLDGKDAQWNLEDIEMKNVQIDLNDDAMTTHVYVAGAASPNGGGGGGIVGWLESKGVATVENEFLFNRMTLAAPSPPGEKLTNGKDIMARFGVRPLTRSMSSIMRGPMEFLVAMQTFMTKWAEQYSTQIETTFMPEVFPGMRVHLVDHGLQVYVSEVTHSGDFESGFTTSMIIMAPSNPSLRKMASSIYNATAEDLASRLDLFQNRSEVAS
jgi:cell wall-associated NlpC family hydrolase